MLGLFKKKIYQPSVTQEDKDWVENNIVWFIEVFGLDKLKERPFISPTIDNFPYSNLNDMNQFQKLFEQLCEYWEVKSNEIKVKFFDDTKSKQWSTWMIEGKINAPLGLYNQIYTTDEKRFSIEIAKSNLDNPQLLISVIAHELAHVKLLGENYINRTDPDMEPLTDLASIYFGFGVIVANSVQTKDIYWISRSGYLPNQLISYANALICYITQQDSNNYNNFLNGNTIDLFKKDIEYLYNTNDTILTRAKVCESELSFKISKQISEGFAQGNFDEVINGSKKLLEKNPKNIDAFNNIGYALLLQKEYQEAIKQFTKAIDIAPYLAYAYNNRGFCKLQLDDIDNAHADLFHSFEMNPDNSFAWRNLGVYYLIINEFDKAIQHFEQAEKIDPKTEMINFYLGQAHLKLENFESANKYLNKSKELKEHNYSTIE